VKTHTPGHSREPAEEKLPPTYTSVELGLIEIDKTETEPPPREGGWDGNVDVRRSYVIRPSTLSPLTVPVSDPPAYRVSPWTAKARIIESLESDDPTPVVISEFDPLRKRRLLIFDPFDPVAVKCPPRIVTLRPPFS
jgi:hypothetical protein